MRTRPAQPLQAAVMAVVLSACGRAETTSAPPSFGGAAAPIAVATTVSSGPAQSAPSTATFVDATDWDAAVASKEADARAPARTASRSALVASYRTADGRHCVPRGWTSGRPGVGACGRTVDYRVLTREKICGWCAFELDDVVTLREQRLHPGACCGQLSGDF